MKRSHVIALAVALAVLGALIPMTGMLYVSWTQAVRKEQARLALYAGRTITRANNSLGEARTALLAIADFMGAPCSAEHIDRMRALVLQTHSIEQMGYFEEGRVKCTSWGQVQNDTPMTPAHFVTADGIEVAMGIRPQAGPASEKIAMRYGAHHILIDQARLVDVIVDSDIAIAIAIATAAGMPIAMLNSPDPALIRRIIADPIHGLDDDYLFAVARDPAWIAIAVAPREHLLGPIRREQMLLLPLGAFIAAFMVGLVVWVSRRRLSPLGELSLAVRHREFIVHYQPIIELATGACIGAEALVRWRRPDGVLMRPDFFIPLAEESGLILPITDQVIEAVLAEMGPLLRADPALHIAINLAAEDLRTARFLPILRKAMEKAGVAAPQIWLEATERGFIDIEAARATIEQVRALGHSVAIDDFGTGYSSLSYLQGFPLDALKIDKSFVDTLVTDSVTSSVTPHIIGMAKTLQLSIIAEGIETQGQMDYLLDRGVEFGQGWLFSRPLPAREFTAYCYEKLATIRVPA
ncbi:EAL domain-containing protein [Roseococcus sp.]|uniref:EAL domain-containing protein n=1 Tax=Roseococcus sp. TaxID=2109646 RepID=UPI003BAD8542